MSKYNSFAKRLDAAFLSASEKQKKALDDFEAAEKLVKDATTPVEKAEADAAYKKAKAELQDVQRHTWGEFQRTRDNLTRELQDAVDKSQALNADDVDSIALGLLSSDMVTGNDLKEMASKYAGNVTMQRAIASKADALAEKEKNPDKARDLRYLSHQCSKSGTSETMENWDKLCSVSQTYSGEMGRNKDAAYICKINSHWSDDNIQAAIKDF